MVYHDRSVTFDHDSVSLLESWGRSAGCVVALGLVTTLTVIVLIATRGQREPRAAQAPVEHCANPQLDYAWSEARPRTANVRGTNFTANETITLRAAHPAGHFQSIALANAQSAADGSFSIENLDLSAYGETLNGWVLIAHATPSGCLKASLPLHVLPLPTPTASQAGAFAPPAPSPTPVDYNAIGVWFGEFFAKRDFSPPPAHSTIQPQLVNYWGRTPPHPSLAINNFSAVFTRTENFLHTQSYLFDLQVDGAARVFLDGQPILDQWFNGKLRRAAKTVPIQAGLHTLRVEYYNTSGGAALCLSWLPGVFTGWEGRYYNNTNFSGAPVLIRDDAELNFDWGEGAPDPRIPGDGFSVDWQRRVRFPASGEYRFVVEADDWVRVFIDGREIEALSTFYQGPGSREARVRLRGGYHHLQVQLVEYSAAARLKLRWEMVIVVPTAAPPRLCSPPSC
ncbi:MAG: PA14 domain-containing protein [Anaerolineae bacterium]|nr:PA14 domain-containing protein [Candidatus Roseilinea sp.]MDW8450467.1 PA14 domain-containing protein [Anaerolineae bacterium]